jgi:hypothetical protein
MEGAAGSGIQPPDRIAAFLFFMCQKETDLEVILLFSRHFLAIFCISRHFLAMKRSAPRKWLEPFRLQSEMGAADYESAFAPRLPRRTALNRLNRLRAAGWLDRFGETRATVYCLTQKFPLSAGNQTIQPLSPQRLKG